MLPLGFTIAVAPGVLAADLLVSVSATGAARAPRGAAIEITAVPTSGAGVPVAASAPLRPPGQTTEARLELPAGLWRVRAGAAGYWSPEAIVLADDKQPRRIDLRLWPLAGLEVQTREGTEAPPLLSVSFRGSESAPGTERVPEGSTSCVLAQNTAACEIPAGLLDLRLGASGLIPAYLWELRLESSTTRAVKDLILERGASIVGFVRSPEGQPAANAQVELTTLDGRRIGAAAPTLGHVERDETRFPWSASTNKVGFFQVRRVTPGEYMVAATDRTGAAASLPVVVQDSLESRLPEPLVIEKPLALDLRVQPPTHPGGHPWTVRFVRASPATGVPVVERQIPRSGRARIEPLTKGDYGVEVWHGGERWLSEAITVEDNPAPLVIHLATMRVRGTVTLGEEPLSASLVFGGKGGPQEIEFRSDAEGHFSGFLPRSGAWVVKVQSDVPAVSRTLGAVAVEPGAAPDEAEVVIALEETMLQGQVVDEEGRPAKGVVKTISEAASRDRPNLFFTDDEGRFSVQGLPSGPVSISAQTEGGGMSDTLSVTLGADTDPVRLVARRIREVNGRLVSAGTGLPIAGGTILAWPADRPRTGSPLLSTDPEGRFKLRVPSEATWLEVLCWADGHALGLSREQAPDEGELVLELEPRGGRLVIQVPEGWDYRDVRAPAILVMRRGAGEGIQVLQRLGLRRFPRVPPPSQPTESAVVLPEMATGEYSVCTTDKQAYQDNRASATAQCVRGLLLPGAALRLTSPPLGGP